MLPLTSRIAAWFPAGSNEHPSEAKNQIWQNWSDFENKGRALELEISKLAVVNTSKPADVAAQVRVVTQACTACHETYREKRRRVE